MQIIKVTNNKTRKEFFQVARELYRHDRVWVCPLDSEIESKFDPEKNIHLRKGNACRWILKSKEGNLIGRIAAFYNREKAMQENQPTGGIGYFECVDNRDAAFLLFDTARDWLQGEGMEAMDGPVNFGENDSNWGLLVKGFTHPGYGMPYNFPYYKTLFEEYGFRLYFRQYSYHLDLKKKFPERFWKIAEWVSQKPDFNFQHFRFSETEKFVRDMVSIYNDAWSGFKEHFTPLNPDDVKQTLNKAKPIIDEELIWFAYHNEQPIAFFIMFPDVNQIFRHLKGKLSPWNIIRFLVMKKRKKITRIRALVAGVVPKFQNAGIESAIFWNLNEVMKHKRHYEEVELSWVGDFNPKMRKLYEAVGGTLAKTHITYRYMFDQSAHYERFMPEVFAETRKKAVSKEA